MCPKCSNPLSTQRQAQRKKYCYLCETKIRREQRERQHDRRVEALYGLRPGDYRRLYIAQNGHCAIHNCLARGLRIALAVDHDHALGLHNRKAVRGLLCKFHNRMFGHAGDDPEVFDSMAEYLRSPPAHEVLR